MTQGFLMGKKGTKAIWNPATGITELQPGWEALGASAIPGIQAVWESQREQLQETEQFRAFTERLSREWAIETGIIENLYDIERGITQTLIEHGFQAELLSHGSTNKPREYVIQLLRDQQEALQGVFDFVKDDRSLSASYVKELHAVLLRSQATTEAIDSLGAPVEVKVIKGDWKVQKNFPERDGVVYTYCPPEQTASEMDRLVAMHANHVTQSVPAEVQTAWLHHRFTQIHPFQDGNGRVARAIASMVLIKNGLFPLVVTRDDKHRYLDALEAADAGDLKPLIELVVKLQILQFRKASAISESILPDRGVESALGGLRQTADRVAAERRQALEQVFDLAKALETDLVSFLGQHQGDIEESLQRAASGRGSARVLRSGDGNDYYYRRQIVVNAKQHLGYFADASEYRSWVALNMRWNDTRQAKLVFATHGIGRPFNGSLICAPFLEFKDTDEEDETRTSLIPVADEGFVFFYNEEQARLLARFRPWRDQVFTVAVKEIDNSLW